MSEKRKKKLTYERGHFFGPVQPNGKWTCQVCGYTTKAPPLLRSATPPNEQ